MKIGSTRSPSRSGQPRAAVRDVAPLSRRVARRRRTRTCALALVVDVREPVLVQADRRPRDAARAPARRPAPAGSPRGRPGARARRTASSSASSRASPQPASSSRKKNGDGRGRGVERAPSSRACAAITRQCHAPRDTPRSRICDISSRGCVPASAWHPRRSIRRLRPHGLPARVRDVHRQRAAARRAGGRAAAAVRGQAGRGARARAPPPGRRRDPRAAGAPPRRLVADRAAAPLAPRRPRARSCRRSGASRAAARSASPARVATAARPGAARPPHPAVGPAQDLRQGAAAGDRARRPRCSPRPRSATCTRTSPTARPRSPGTPRASPGCRSRSPATRATSTPSTSTRRAGCAASCSPRASSSPAPRRTSATCSAIAPEADVHLVYHGLNADFARLLADAAAAAPTPTATAARARRRPHRGQEGLRRARRRVRRAAPPRRRLRGRDRRPGGQALGRRARAHRQPRPRAATCALPGPMGQERAAARVPPRERAVHAQPPARPTTATGSRTCSSRRWRPGRRSSRAPSPASPSWSSTRSTGCSSRPRTPRRSPTTLLRLHGDPALSRRASPQQARETVARPLRRPDARRAGSPSCSGRRSARDERRRPPPAPRAVRDRARAPQPRGRRRRSSPGASPSRARRARSAPTPTGSARDLPAGRGVADRVGEVRVGARPRARRRRDRRPAVPRAWERLTASWIRQVPPDARRRRGHRPPDPQLDLRLAAPRARRGPRRRCCFASLASRSRTSARTSRRSATTARSSSTRCWSPRSRCPSSTATGCSSSPSPSSTATSPTDFRPDGVHREASTHYHAIALRSFVGARENARRYGIELPAGFDERLARALRVRSPTARARTGRSPRCRTPTPATTGRLLLQAAELLGDEELRFVGSRGRAGRPPARRHASFPDGGYLVQRSGWDPEARFLIFDCGPLGDGGHGHYDLLSFEAHAGGRPLVVDPGRGSYSEAPPNLRRWFRGTAAHNTVCVDGLDQTPYSRGRPRGPVARGRLLGRGTAPGLDVLAGEARSPAYEAVHQRRIAFVAERYWVDRGPAATASASTATTSASTWRPRRRAPRASTARRCSRPALALLDPRRRGGRARARLDRAALRRAARRAGRQRRRARDERALRHGARAAASAVPRLGRAIGRGRWRGAREGSLLRARPGRAAARRAARRAADGGAARRRPDRRRGRRCERVNAKYRVGDSLRVVYRSTPAARPHTVAGRTFRGRSASVYRRAAAAAAPDAGPPPPCSHAPELETVFWTFPNDRRLAGLRLLDGRSGALDRLVGRARRPHAAGGLRARARRHRRSAATPAAACSPT